MFDHKKFVDSLLQALDDKDVIEAIKKITAKDAIGVQTRENTYEDNILSKKIGDLESEIKEYIWKIAENKKIVVELEQKIKILEENNRSIVKENDVLQKKLMAQQKIIDEKDEKIQSIADRFKEPEDLYLVYLQLSDATRCSLNGIFKGNTVEEFLFCGVQLENIESLWDFIKQEAIQGKLREIKYMMRIFEYFFKAYNSIHESPIYSIQNVTVGEEFDEDRHLRGSNSRVTGRISEVILNGYINAKTGKVVKKSIVRI